ncbi:hypothetical protein P3G55_07570 [Leptospira sp. 96542]|nr:hypothetical protein [Leptospira sp. 96542]
MKSFFSLTLVCLLVVHCAPPIDKVDTNDAQSQIYAAAKFAADKCGTPIPQPPLIVIHDPIQRNLDLCTIAITRTECPFNGYPLPCLLIYLEKDSGDLPWYLNFNELSKIQIK